MVVVYVDEREKSSRVPSLLSSMGVTVIFKALDVGDYIVSERIGIERKSANDFVKSIVDGRLFDQARRLREVFEKPVIIIEGSLSKALKAFNVRRSAVQGAYLALGIDMGIVIVFTRSEEESAEIIKRLAIREQEKQGGVKAISVRKPRLSTVEEWQLYILQCFPHIGPKTARRILEVLGSIQRFCNASPSELAKIEGLSEKKASEIVQILRAVYRGYMEKRCRKETRSIIDYMSKVDAETSGSQSQQT
ncbi:MAG TPA: hypothetical protein EYH02_00800 [Ignisphaera aggregans]|uniref:ERCC4 domain-containing protein n=1 Tax=Ignisphaera aggregans TaxID=334771 RepID=A0A833DTY0_9CREN|nr:hypothetical protein [Ignisphaera aggregans]